MFITKTVPECLKLLKPRYGICETEQRTLDEHHRKDFEMEPLRSDPALYKKNCSTVRSLDLVVITMTICSEPVLPTFRKLSFKTH